MWNGSFTSWGIFSLGFLASIHLLNPLSLLYFYAWQRYHQFYFNFIVVKLQEGASYRLYTSTVAMLFGIKCLEIFETIIIYYYKLHNDAVIRDFRMTEINCVQGRGARFQHFNGFKNEMSCNVWSSCLVLLPQRENDTGTTCSNAPLSTTRTGCYHFSNIAPSGVSSPHGWEVQVLLKTTSAGSSWYEGAGRSPSSEAAQQPHFSRFCLRQQQRNRRVDISPRICLVPPTHSR